MRFTTSEQKRRELREDMTRDQSEEPVYTGALFGMGGLGNPQDLNKVAPVYQEHDVELAFDVEIDRHDMMQVDMIREGMNDFQGMAENHKTTGRSMPQVEKKQRELRQRVLHFLFRPRQEVQPMKWRRQYDW